MKNSISSKSPKNKFRIELISKKPISGLGSSFSVGVMTLEDLENDNFYKHYRNMVKQNGGGYVTIKENKKTYPEFEWVNVENFEI